MKCTEAITSCALCPIKRLTQQWLGEPTLIILFNSAVTSDLHVRIRPQHISPLRTKHSIASLYTLTMAIGHVSRRCVLCFMHMQYIPPLGTEHLRDTLRDFFFFNYSSHLSAVKHIFSNNLTLICGNTRRYC